MTLFHPFFGVLRMTSDQWINYHSGMRYAAFLDVMGNYLGLPLDEVSITPFL